MFIVIEAISAALKSINMTKTDYASLNLVKKKIEKTKGQWQEQRKRFCSWKILSQTFFRPIL